MSESKSLDIPEKGWTNPFPEGHPLHDLYGRRIRNNQDIAIVVDDYHARRGTGKTIASLQLAEGMDQSETGMTKDKVTMHPEAIREAYSNAPKRSGLVLDEGEVGASNRQAMTKTNQALREIMSMGRVEEKYVIINTPSIGFLDKDVRLLADVWITMLAKGIGLVHYLKRQPYANQGNGKLLTEKKGLIEFSDITKGTRLREIYNELTAQKRAKIRGEEEEGFIPRSEHTEKLEKAKKEVKRENRNEYVESLIEHPDVQFKQEALAECFDVSQSWVSMFKNNEIAE